ncbi:methylated-DNA--[protein]-cysteine S-methyltransferase [Infirmifilum lucidum]|uniref:Methylated-DNA--[protein]-cysteine S-methyltransferase n=1 Tax=Infirmifilum lucidum TaxID=2776706 RepID=A0A7L9FHR6_9CREN|nr:methylated-DNA--[protein]-cysteine S-methyltransferase [Infirmifilum lucidum]QOJ78456.1 methylated-DNA--[protein]-cysteine S-methyltransferase [Infirmifilum lucidum]
MKEYGCLDTPIGELCFIVDGREVLALHSREKVKPVGLRLGENALALKEELREYFEGSRKDFTFRPVLSGPDFKRRVLEEVLKIPYGLTTTYKDIALKLSTSPRAVAMVLKSNSVLILVPCHRVVSSTGWIGGYALGVAAKAFLLNLERASQLSSQTVLTAEWSKQ